MSNVVRTRVADFLFRAPYRPLLIGRTRAAQPNNRQKDEFLTS